MRFLKLIFPDPTPRCLEVNKVPDPTPSQQPRRTLLEKVAERQRTASAKHCHCCCCKRKGNNT